MRQSTSPLHPGLARGQLASGEWNYRIDFDAEQSRRWHYRRDVEAGDTDTGKRRNRTLTLLARYVKNSR